ncbi:MAG TPA: hypothetical protein VGO22_05810, partial [Pseudorhizobium sp.]|nr:hypothetical protein [Pseudorhizobium sp.]
FPQKGYNPAGTPLPGVKLGWSGHGGFSETGADSLTATVGATGAWRVQTSRRAVRLSASG